MGEVPSASEAERVVNPPPASNLAPSLKELSAQLTEDVPPDCSRLPLSVLPPSSHHLLTASVKIPLDIYKC